MVLQLHTNRILSGDLVSLKFLALQPAALLDDFSFILVISLVFEFIKTDQWEIKFVF